MDAAKDISTKVNVPWAASFYLPISEASLKFIFRLSRSRDSANSPHYAYHEKPHNPRGDGDPYHKAQEFILIDQKSRLFI